MTLPELQKMIRDTYGAKDESRGADNKRSSLSRIPEGDRA